ncbi:FAD-dependent oxidoreductase (plasmid) [Klebsiella michiganensis]|uniref:FAD-dependent oxidoreductase n=1 Tax=Klebsiella michiganensis TaxID=1134687 RepID=UPI00265B2D3A|nr:FAD-dependent oxidoreductase [Klebsiella michiganensis]WKJ95755.1 FAD-dependent oxidoreductase [Klebsiella michiganensis]WKK00979.1 FAD-dependent oxidoreductase [Klebsiella michiganensis]WKK02899.1 FAD-dependent oxidoreductase [Klebsiella michiganensis]WKK06982.1 FAD-dependent oxidoreductase [Klebsiella michiganensis]
MNTVFDVAVIGAGSTGATIAAMLAERQEQAPGPGGSFASMNRICLCWHWPGSRQGVL